MSVVILGATRWTVEQQRLSNTIVRNRLPQIHQSSHSVVTLSAKNNQKLSKFLSKGFERLLYWNKYKTKKYELKYDKRA